MEGTCIAAMHDGEAVVCRMVLVLVWQSVITNATLVTHCLSYLDRHPATCVQV